MSDSESNNDEVEQIPIKVMRRKDISKVQLKKRQKVKKSHKDLEISEKLKQMIESKLEKDQVISLKPLQVEAKTTTINLQQAQTKISHGIQIVYQTLPKARPSSNFLDKIRAKANQKRMHHSQLLTMKK